MRKEVKRKKVVSPSTPGLRFSKNPNYLFFAESTSLHVLLLLLSRTSNVTSPF